MVLDDDPDIRVMLKLTLEHIGGYQVTIAGSEAEAEIVLRAPGVDLIIMDMFLSGTHGCDVCTQYKKDSRAAHIPILMISAYPYAEKECLEAGANDFISKPFDMNELLSRIETLLNSSLRSE